jgi:cyclic di-GMP phosphodiesterase
MPPDHGQDERPPPTVLVIEDEGEQAAVLAATLRDAGFAVVAAGAGLDGLGLVEAVRPDLVILDLKLPDVSGFRVLKILKEDRHTAILPVLVLTALSFAEAEKVARYGADGFLTKPYVVEELLVRVQDLVAGSGGTGAPTKVLP